ncbi:Hypothetical protein NTJ_09149 [Nesidiocoris tenuis]|uniref:Uncharacterized protein n=1 Tax=Nesidiocoris tenuis TaxID=355587 RepID=A0ABN7AVX2_9HEMI|nr:Hypothetical protein NTJ_09149 [Nesidiocoris tenuis]
MEDYVLDVDDLKSDDRCRNRAIDGGFKVGQAIVKTRVRSRGADEISCSSPSSTYSSAAYGSSSNLPPR